MSKSAEPNKTNESMDGDAAKRRRGALPCLGWALCFALAFLFAFPPFSIWPAAFLAPLPLAFLARRPGGWRWPAFALWLAGTLLFLFEHRWQVDVSVAGYPAGAALMGLYFAATLLSLRFLHRRLRRAPFLLLLPLVWTAFEVVRGEYLFDGYAFYLLAHPTLAWPAFPQAADLLGVYFVSFLTVLPAGALVDSLTGRRECRACRFTPAAATVVLLLLLGLYGGQRLRETPTAAAGPSVRVAAVQTNVPQDNKMRWSFEQASLDYRRAIQLTEAAALATPTPDLIVWPETMLPAGFGLNAEAVDRMRQHHLAGAVFADEVLAYQRQLGVPLLLGAFATEGLTLTPDPDDPRLLLPDFTASYNSAYLLQGGAVSPERYDKLYLTPFGETIPHLNAFDRLEEAVLWIGARGMAFDLTPGQKPVVLRASLPEGGTLRLATPICFEATSTSVCRRLVYAADGVKQADLLINLSNDGWFGGARGAREQHLQAARFRCIELRTPMLRSANTGLSAAIDSAGRLLAVGPDNSDPAWNVDGVLAATIPLDGRDSAYARLGGVFGLLVLLLTALLFGQAVWLARKEGTRCPSGVTDGNSSSA